MRYADFSDLVARLASRVEPQFLDGVDGIEVTRSTIPHPVHAEVYTLGECVPRAFGPDDEGPRMHSRILLHHGSFQALARITDGFDWEREAWETLTHELRHHLEWRARVPALEALDDAVDANYARHDGMAFAPLFFLDGEKLADDVYKVEDDIFFDQIRLQDVSTGIQWHGQAFSVPLPDEKADILFLALEGLTPEPAGDVVLVLRRRPGIRDLWHAPVVVQKTVKASKRQSVEAE